MAMHWHSEVSMYTDVDLNVAVDNGIFTNKSVEEFRAHISGSRHSPTVDEENFRLITGFNDIFVVISLMLFLCSLVWVTNSFHQSLSMILISIMSWAFAEFFVIRRKMALPAIVLLLTYIGGIFTACIFLFGAPSTESFILAAAVSAIAAWLHWKRFQVPITIAAGTATAITFFIATIISMYPNTKDWFLYIALFCGVVTFILAMYWDSSDRSRTSRQSDVAFWLHLLSAPLIVHPIFSSLGILAGNDSLISITIIVLMYLLMTMISLVIDRRAFMVSSLIYVLYALSTLLKTYGFVGYNVALTGVFIGLALLLLSGFWHKVRVQVVELLPKTIQARVPIIQ